MKKKLTFILLIVLLFGLSSCLGKNEEINSNKNANNMNVIESKKIAVSGISLGKGDISLSAGSIDNNIENKLAEKNGETSISTLSNIDTGINFNNN